MLDFFSLNMDMIDLILLQPPVDSGDVTNGQIQSFDRSITPLLPDFMDPTLCYLPNAYSYYYGGYDGTGNDWGEDYSRYMNPDGVEMSQVSLTKRCCCGFVCVI